jgi:hypothetical protein
MQDPASATQQDPAQCRTQRNAGPEAYPPSVMLHSVPLRTVCPGRNEALPPYSRTDATTDADRITMWWTRSPDSNIGCVFRAEPDAEGRPRVRVLAIGVPGR